VEGAMKPIDLVQGTLDLLILKSIGGDSLHGWAIARRIRQLSREVLQVQQGSLYPALHRLEDQGLIKATWGVSEQNRRAKFYSLTRAGQKRLDHEAAQWHRLASAITMVVSSA
jgi:PadR family transcriptional regulator